MIDNKTANVKNRKIKANMIKSQKPWFQDPGHEGNFFQLFIFYSFIYLLLLF
jgi:hypothetical protein